MVIATMQLRRFFAALLIVVSALMVSVPDAIVIQRHVPHDRIWLLVLYAALPALVAAVVVLTTSSSAKSLVMAGVALGPQIARFALGPGTTDAAFERLSMNAFWFAVHWLPIACAAIVLLQTGTRSPRLLVFHRRVWRFGAALLLLFMASTFIPKSSPEWESSVLYLSVSFGACLVGMVLMVSDLIPSGIASVVLEWSWLAFAFFSLLATMAAGLELDSEFRERSMIRYNITSSQETLADIRAINKKYEARGELTDDDRVMIQGRVTEVEARIRSYKTALARPPLGIVYATFLLVLSTGMTLLFILLFRQAWRDRRALRNSVTQVAEG
jgi:hypothetical protein